MKFYFYYPLWYLFAYYHHPTNYGMQKIGFACDIAQWKYRMKVMKFWIKCTKWNKIIIEIYNVFYYKNFPNRFASYQRDIFCFYAWCFSPRSRLDAYCKEMHWLFAWWNSLHKGPVFYVRLMLAQTIFLASTIFGRIPELLVIWDVMTLMWRYCNT